MPPQAGAGGKLEVAGVVVGQWGANHNFPVVPPSRGSGLLMHPQVNIPVDETIRATPRNILAINRNLAEYKIAHYELLMSTEG